MIFNLVEKKHQKISTIVLVDIDTEDIDPENKKKIIVTAPAHHDVSGEYKIWKYGDYGYVWARTYPNTNTINILFFDDEGTSYDPNGPFRSHADSYIYIYRLDPIINSLGMQQIARGETMFRHGNETTKWYVQDQTTLQWNSTQNIHYSMS